MTTQIYLHKNGGFPNTHKDCHPSFVDDIVLIFDDKGEVVREYDMEDVYRVDVLMETE